MNSLISFPFLEKEENCQSTEELEQTEAGNRHSHNTFTLSLIFFLVGLGLKLRALLLEVGSCKLFAWDGL
jgi:hypothetical protein